MKTTKTAQKATDNKTTNQIKRASLFSSKIHKTIEHLSKEINKKAKNPALPEPPLKPFMGLLLLINLRSFNTDPEL